jgi:tetratricopeptide (TPR) repeat protein
VSLPRPRSCGTRPQVRPGPLQKALELDPRYARAHFNLGLALRDKGDTDGAIRCFDAAIRCHQKALELDPRDASAHNSLAWALATCPDPKLRDAPRAVTLAKKAVELKPNHGNSWNTLGVAHYRAGDWKAAVEALNKSEELRPGQALGFNGLFLAMAHWQRGDQEQARRWYDKAVQWAEKNQPQNEELRRFRSEAAELLGIQKPPR